MIRPDDRTPEERSADLRADVQAALEAEIEAEIHDGIVKALRILVTDGHLDCARAITAACAQVADLKARVQRQEESMDELRDIAHSGSQQ